MNAEIVVGKSRIENLNKCTFAKVQSFSHANAV
jgi:hypothetical protein